MVFLWGVFLVVVLAAGLFYPWTGLFALLAAVLTYALHAPPGGLMLILLLVGAVLAVGLVAVPGLLGPRRLPDPSRVMAAGLAALLVGGALAGPRWGVALAGLAGARELLLLKEQGKFGRYWSLLAAWLAPRVGVLILWTLHLIQVVGSL
ncbi:MAG: hypothetical protein IMW96_06085 [Thermoanaerobacteraceae bacterium]|uniref:hypothetical protein n=1 Tax=Thermanaeromonas sp. C210 TaxID=2731925 RepID=UPI00155B516E|nr:hypothetical protein [Thermanaeromonas sp. C210]MBE3581190.1 hypothetical protein [Thermoanaerobacteraceae bacterium]GFN23200.1 hypothetical protein TAMC210_15170 [Thermanaeromonas sp. C210]